MLGALGPFRGLVESGSCLSSGYAECSLSQVTFLYICSTLTKKKKSRSYI